MPPRIDFSEKIRLDPDHKKAFRAILRDMFPDYQRVVVESEFTGDTFSGSWVFLAHRLRDRMPDLPVIVKIASVSLINKEWHTFKEHIWEKWPCTAPIKDEPVFSKDGTLGGLYYDLVGDGIFPVKSLRSYCLEQTTTVEEIEKVLERFAAVIEYVAHRCSEKRFKFLLRASYDPMLPVNLLVKPTSLPPDVEPVVVTPQALPLSSLELESYVHLEGFAVTKVDLKKHTVTLNLPHPTDQLPTDSYYVRLKLEADEAMPTYTIGQIIPTIEGRVIQTRYSQWQAEMKGVMADQEFDLDRETISLASGTEFPNPFIALENILSQYRDIRASCIHGDLNLGNLVVDPKVQDMRLIDFAEARWDHILHDFLRLETEVMTKFVAPALTEDDSPAETICRFYEQLHLVTFHPNQNATGQSPCQALDKPFAILKATRRLARNYGLFRQDDYTEYYDCLTIYLLGALKFANLNEMLEAPLPKQVAFWGAAAIQKLLKTPPSLEKARRPTWRATAAIAVVFLAIGLFVSILLRDIFSSSGPPLAVIASFMPKVEVKQVNTDRLQPASFGIPLYQDDVVITYDDAAATIVCESGLVFGLPEQSTLTVDCKDTTDQRIVGRLEPINVADAFTNTLVLREIRAPQSRQGNIPFLLDPRNTVITNTRPTFHWQPVPGATGYRLSLISPSGPSWNKQTLDASLPYPADEPPLTIGSASVIILETLDDTNAVDETVLQVLDETSLAELTNAEAAIQALTVDEITREYLLTQLYRERELWAATIGQLEWLVSEWDITSAYLFQQLGDLYAEVELYGQAEENYRMAGEIAETSADKSAQAAAYVGLAQTARAFGETEDALAYLATAEDLYRQTGEAEREETIATARTKLERPTPSNYTWAWVGSVILFLLTGVVVVWVWRNQSFE